MREQDKHTAIFTILIVFFTAFFGFNFIYRPSIKNIAKLKTNLAGNKDLEDSIYQIKKLRENLDSYNSRLIKDDVSGFLNRIAKIAESAQINLMSIKPQSPQDAGSYRKLILNISFKSTYHNLGRFISLLENSQSFIRIDECHLIVEQFSSKSASIADIEMVVSAFVEK